MLKHHTDHELPPEKRRREVSSKTANKHVIANTPTKTSSTEVTEPNQAPPSTSTTPSATTLGTPLATQARKSTPAVGKDSTESSSEIPMDSNVEAGDSSAPQASSTPPPINGKSSRDNVISSVNDLPIIDDKQVKQVMIPPKRIENASAMGTIGDYPTHLDDILWTGPPKKKSAKVTAMVSFNRGTSDEDTKVLVTIANSGLDTRFEVTQEGSES